MNLSNITPKTQIVPINAIENINKYDSLVNKYLSTKKYLGPTMNYVLNVLISCDKFMKKRTNSNTNDPEYTVVPHGAMCELKIRRRFINQLQAATEAVIYNTVRQDMLMYIDNIVTWISTNIIQHNNIQNTYANRQHFYQIVQRHIHYSINTRDRSISLLIRNKDR